MFEAPRPSIQQVNFIFTKRRSHLIAVPSVPVSFPVVLQASYSSNAKISDRFCLFLNTLVLLFLDYSINGLWISESIYKIKFG